MRLWRVLCFRKIISFFGPYQYLERGDRIIFFLEFDEKLYIPLILQQINDCFKTKQIPWDIYKL